MKLYYLYDKTSKLPYHPRFNENVATELRNMSLELREAREKNNYAKVAIWEDSDLIELDLQTKEIKNIPEFRGFFGSPEKVENNGKENK